MSSAYTRSQHVHLQLVRLDERTMPAGLLGGLGNVLPPVLTEPLAPIVGPIQVITNPVTTPVGQVLEPIITPITTVTNPVTQTVNEIVAPIVEPVTTTVNQVIAPVVDPVTQTVNPLVGPLQAPLTNIVNPVVAPVTAIVTPVTQTVGQTLTPVTTTVGQVVTPVTNVVTQVVTPVTTAVGQVVTPVTQTVGQVVTPLTQTVGQVVTPVTNVVTQVVTPVTTTVGQTINPVTTPGAAVVTPVTTTVGQVTAPVTPTVPSATPPSVTLPNGTAVNVPALVSAGTPVRANAPALATPPSLVAAVTPVVNGGGNVPSPPTVVVGPRQTGGTTNLPPGVVVERFNPETTVVLTRSEGVRPPTTTSFGYAATTVLPTAPPLVVVTPTTASGTTAPAVTSAETASNLFAFTTDTERLFDELNAGADPLDLRLHDSLAALRQQGLRGSGAGTTARNELHRVPESAVSLVAVLAEPQRATSPTVPSVRPPVPAQPPLRWENFLHGTDEVPLQTDLRQLSLPRQPDVWFPELPGAASPAVDVRPAAPAPVAAPPAGAVKAATALTVLFGLGLVQTLVREEKPNRNGAPTSLPRSIRD
jgi:hypothetical protein